MKWDKPTHNPRVRYDKTYPGHKKYLLYLYGIFKDLTRPHPIIQTRKLNKKIN